MLESNQVHLLALGVLLARIADIGSTYIVTPQLQLEANEVVRRYRWPFAVFTLLLCLVPYFNPGGGLLVLVMSLLVSASNIRSAWVVRAIGESEYVRLLRHAASRSSKRACLACIWSSASLIAAAAIVLLLFYPSPSWAWHFAFGMLAYAFAVGLHGSTFATRIFGRAEENRTPANKGLQLTTDS